MSADRCTYGTALGCARVLALVACGALACITSCAVAAAADAVSLPYSPGLDLKAMDRSVDPCTDLYTYACGGWQKANPIPPEQSSWDVYSKLAIEVRTFLKGILEQLAPVAASRSPEQQRIGDYFAACMNVDAVEAAGSAPLQGELARIAGLPDKRALGALLGALHTRTWGSGLLFASGVEQDARDASRMIASVDAGGLGLPDRDYYTKQDAKAREIRTRYRAHIARVMTLLGEPHAAAQADAKVVMRIETALAASSLTMVDKRDPYKVYHRSTLDELQKLAPELDWSAYFKASGLVAAPWLNVSELHFASELSAQLARESLEDLKTYLRWAVAASSSRYLSSGFVAEDFAFNHAYLLGTEVDQPRWQKCVAWVDRDLGEDLGREFVAREFPAATQAAALHMTEEIETAMRERIERLTWMTPETKAQALAKLAAVRNKIGYPRHWRDYSPLVIRRDDFFGNVQRAAEFESHREAAKIGRPVDRDEWEMTPQTVNAYYDPQLNDINFPAAVLLPPLFDARMDAAPNYGNTGGTIGHELTHGFDDSGRQYDGAGNLRNWWTPTDAKQFDERAQCVRDQYAAYTVVDDVKINSALTAGEDIADLGGELLAWMAWQADQEHKAAAADPAAKRDGLTESQRFFVGFAQWACGNVRPQRLRASAMVDPHSPPRYRINGVVSNMPEFAEAFHCRTGQALVKPASKRCVIW